MENARVIVTKTQYLIITFYLFLAITCTDTGSEENSDQQHQNKPGLSSGTP